MKKYLNKALPLTVAGLLFSVGATAQEAAYYSTDFKASSLADIGFVALDLNGDGVVWTPMSANNHSFSKLDGETVAKMELSPTTIGNAWGSTTNDDWLISPMIRFEAGKTYKTSILMSKYSFAALDDVFEVKMGDEKDPDAMSTTLIALSDGDLPEAPGNSLWTKNLEIKVEQTGDYCIGIHAVGTSAGRFGVARLSIANGVAMVTPAAIEDLTLTPDPIGDKKVTLSFTTPTKAKDGTTLTALTKVEILRNGDLIKTLSPAAPGEAMSYTDVVAVSGTYTYSVKAYTEAGGGDVASATTFVGVNTPTAVPAVYTANTGLLSSRVSWDAPAVDKDGYPIAASLLKYDVYRSPLYSSERTQVAKSLTTTSFDDTLVDAPEGQQFYNYYVVAKTVEGQAAETVGAPVPMGEAYAAPYAESFVNGRAATIVTSTPLKGNNYWSVSRDFDDVSSADGDNGMMYLNGQIGGGSALYTGLVDLAGMPSPTLNYYTYNITGCDPADNTLQVTVAATDGTVKEFDTYVPAMGWNKTILPIDEFVGKVIRVTFNGYRMNNTELHLDALAVSNIYRHDLKATGINAPSTVRSSEPFDVVVDVVNFGSEVAGDYTVELYCDGVKVDRYSATGLAVGAYDHVKFSRTHGILDPAAVEYSAKVIYAADQDETNNEAGAVKLTVRKNAYPVVNDLSGSINNGVVTLTWGEPDTEKAQPYEVFDNFESYDSWATANVGDWVFVDQDKAQIAGFTEGVMPGIDVYSQQSWWVFDNTHEDFNNGSFATISGHKFLASMISGFTSASGHTPGYAQNDDWAISPELYGGPQTISVNARSYSLNDSELETFEILYSTGSVDPADFVTVATVENVPSEYTAYEFDLPDGAKRFAIRNISYAKYVLMIDDVTYTPVGEPAAFSINGYNVYRDGVKINAEPVEENEYEDADCGDGNHVYNVSVIYAAGESQLSNDCNPYSSGVEAVEAVESVPAEYYNLQGIRVARPEGGQLYIKRKGSTAVKVRY